jgi:hypothetical protein
MTVGPTDLQVLHRKRRVNWDLYLVVGILKLALMEGNTGDNIFLNWGSFFMAQQANWDPGCPIVEDSR